MSKLKTLLYTDIMNHIFHPLDTSIAEPQSFTYPFNYIPHPLAVCAVERLKKHVMSHVEWTDEIMKGKMFGVLVVKDCAHGLGFLAAYSGLLGGKNDWDYFVPPVYDSMQPDGYFKVHERMISALNEEIAALESCQEYMTACGRVKSAEDEACRKISEYKELMRESKQKRDEKRKSSVLLSAGDEEKMIRESQFQKAELRRLKKHCNEVVERTRLEYDRHESVVRQKRMQRKEMSDKLQRWLFEQYDMMNARGEHRNLCDIFAATVQGVPPSGAGDCCAPKLLQYAYENGMHPVCMAEFWWGRSPKSEVRHHFHYYPACRSKCKPILEFMLQGLDVDPNPHDMKGETLPLKIVFEDDSMIVVSKPSGMLSMPGLVDRASVVDVLREEYGFTGFLMPAHRLDMDTSGLLVVARSEKALRELHRQFAERQVKKRYAAQLEGEIKMPRHGLISLPLAADLADRPRQVVDHDRGKTAVTEYEVVRIEGGKTYISLFPHTGRTHQLRVHCAHAGGLALPIVGDKLYGHHSDCRLMLHAEYIAFRHPVTGKYMQFTDMIW